MSGKKYDLIASGYVSMDRIIKLEAPARVGFTSLISNKNNADIQYGGCAVNIACDLKKLGITAIPIMRVGDDFEKIGFKGFLEASGISLDATEVIEGERTSQCYLLQDNEGQHITLFYPGAMDGKLARPVSDELFENAGMALMTVAAKQDNQYFLEKCREKSLPLVFSMKDDMEAFPKDFLEEILNYSSIIFTNEVEREAIEQIYGYDMRELLEKANCRVLVTTLGADGSKCYWRTEEGIKEGFTPIWDETKVVDTTGSGDAFVAGFLWGYLNGKEPLQCAGYGTIVSSYVIEKEGCCTNAPTVEELLSRYERYQKKIKER